MLVDLLRGAFLHLLRHADGAQPVHVGFRAVVRLVLLPVAEVVEVVAGLAHPVRTHLADDGRVEVPHRLVQDRRHRGGVHQVGDFLRASRIDAFPRIADAIDGGIDEFLLDGVLQNDVAVIVERLLLFERECLGHDSPPYLTPVVILRDPRT